jgi:hypothetical protein
MLRPVSVVASLVLGAAVLAHPAISQTSRPLFTPQDERIEDLPDTPGRDETFGLCVACHGYRIVSNQGMSRERWDETLTWMTERHNMPDLQGADRDLILDYLARHHPPKAPSRAGGFRNPFAPQ